MHFGAVELLPIPTAVGPHCPPHTSTPQPSLPTPLGSVGTPRPIFNAGDGRAERPYRAEWAPALRPQSSPHSSPSNKKAKPKQPTEGAAGRCTGEQKAPPARRVQWGGGGDALTRLSPHWDGSNGGWQPGWNGLQSRDPTYGVDAQWGRNGPPEWGGEVDAVQNKPACRKEAESAPPPSPIPSIGIAAYGAARWGQWDREVSSGIAVHGVGNRNQLRTWKRNLRPTAQPVPCHAQDPPSPPPPEAQPPQQKGSAPQRGAAPPPDPTHPSLQHNQCAMSTKPRAAPLLTDIPMRAPRSLPAPSRPHSPNHGAAATPQGHLSHHRRAPPTNPPPPPPR